MEEPPEDWMTGGYDPNEPDVNWLALAAALLLMAAFLILVEILLGT